ncbi:sulfurtransferase TusA family protein [Legionella micdadei]|uniref:Sulfurtransferase TusA homolog n=1 Tax=Legionella micdadei TaxID=451 RepID=A0A098GIY4_LEGMI|nr:sulfurtransferase TusA family protein [Legionella micdadei]ARG98821.1 recombinase [Legionella micdadei]ARH01543.1 recombinase [Legionella micdadei]KTD26352.1 Sulfurtransferase TusA [Legionella micdadei]NSL19072.1 sulfurtransferase TusA family protein [Legionella micdadei]CEG61935.1 Sulfurtransferase TusA homolog [Legionella micdadei]
MPHYELDARRLLCPMPVIKTQNMSKKLQHGDTITVIATDPGAQHDLPCWCRINGHQLIECKEINGEFHITLQLVKDNA